MTTSVLLALLLWLMVAARAGACEICGAEQPALLRGLTHGGAGPQGGFDYVIVIATAALALFTLVWAIKCLARPGERQADHIKRTVLNPDYDGS